MPGYAMGKVYYKHEGDVRVCATSMCTNIILIETEDSQYGVTPKEEEGFMLGLKEKTV